MTETELGQIETKIRLHLKSYRDVGSALRCIRKAKAYKLRGFDTLYDYCTAEFGFVDRHARRLIEAAEVADVLEIQFGMIPANESVARMFAPYINRQHDLDLICKRLQKNNLTIETAKAVDVLTAIESLDALDKSQKENLVSGDRKLLPAKHSPRFSLIDTFAREFAAHLKASDAVLNLICLALADVDKNISKGFDACEDLEERRYLCMMLILISATWDIPKEELYGFLAVFAGNISDGSKGK